MQLQENMSEHSCLSGRVFQSISANLAHLAYSAQSFFFSPLVGWLVPFLGSGPKGPMSCRTQGRISYVYPAIHSESPILFCYCRLFGSYSL